MQYKILYVLLISILLNSCGVKKTKIFYLTRFTPTDSSVSLLGFVEDSINIIHSKFFKIYIRTNGGTDNVSLTLNGKKEEIDNTRLNDLLLSERSLSFSKEKIDTIILKTKNFEKKYYFKFKPRLFLVLIGNPEEYSGSAKINVKYELEEVKKALTERYNVYDENIYTLYDSDSNKKSMFHLLGYINSMSTNEDNLIIIFYGHGIEIDGDSYIIPNDGSKENTDRNILISTFIRKVESIKFNQALVIINACEIGAYEYDRNNQDLSLFFSHYTFKKITTEYFMPALISFFYTNSKEDIRVIDIYNYVNEKVVSESNNEQEPKLFGDSQKTILTLKKTSD